MYRKIIKMTVKELIDILLTKDQGSEIDMACPSGNHYPIRDLSETREAMTTIYTTWGDDE